MNLNLTAAEARVVGALIEKSLATPEYYPMTLHALQAACNQKSNREPPMQLGEQDIVRALDGLRERSLVWSVDMAGSRVPKYKHAVAETLGLAPAPLAILCELLVRDAQTVAELRAHAGRLVALADATEVEAAVRVLTERAEGPLAYRLARQAGQRGERYIQGLSGPPVEGARETAAPPPEPARQAVQAEHAPIAALAGQVAALQEDVRKIQAAFAEFRKQFE